MMQWFCRLAGVLMIVFTPAALFAQSPAWSRGQQLLPISFDECLGRASQALRAEGYSVEYAAGAFAVGRKDIHTGVIMCNAAPDERQWVNIVVASNGDGGGAQRERLQAQMERPVPAKDQSGFIGCFADAQVFDLDGHLERSANNTPQKCIAVCRQKGFRYAGVQYGESCLCGNSYGKYGGSSKCNMPCTGDSSKICGGFYANSVYGTGQ